MMNVCCQNKLRKNLMFSCHCCTCHCLNRPSVLIILWQFIAVNPGNIQKPLATLAQLHMSDLNSCHSSPILSMVAVNTKYPLLSRPSHNCLPLYTRNVLVLSSNNITYHCYADDTQPNLSFPSGNAQCEAYIGGWHLWMETCPLPQAQPWQERTALLARLFLSSARSFRHH